MFVVSVKGGNCDYSPGASDNLATPLSTGPSLTASLYFETVNFVVLSYNVLRCELLLWFSFVTSFETTGSFPLNLT
jgi:hypothetical protein